MKKRCFALYRFSFVLAFGILSLGCATNGTLIQNSTGYDIEKKTEEDDTLRQRPEWVKNINQPRDENDEYFRVAVPVGEDKTLRTVKVADEEAKKIAAKEIAKYIETIVKVDDKDIEVVTESTYTSETSSKIQIVTNIIVQAVENRSFWEVWETKKDKTGPNRYCLFWLEASIPNTKIEEARQRSEDERSRRSYLEQRNEEEKKFFKEQQDRFSRSGGVEAYFSKIDNLGMESVKIYNSNYNELLDIASRLEGLKTLEDDLDYQGFRDRIGKMKDQYDPTTPYLDRIAAMRESHQKEIVAMRESHQKEIVAMRESNQKEITALGEKHRVELASLHDETIMLRTENKSLQEERDKFYADIRYRLENMPQNPGSGRINTNNNDYIDVIASWPVPTRTELTRAISYTVRRGDTLYQIAREKYGSALYWFWIWRCNSGLISDPNLILTRAVLRLPRTPERLNLQ